MFLLHIFKPNDYTIEISVLLQIQFFYFLSILLNCVENVLLGPKDSFGTKSKKILGRLFKKKCSAKRVLPFCCIRCCPYSQEQALYMCQRLKSLEGIGLFKLE